MAESSKIEWTDATWTAIRARHRATGKIGWHCEHATPGCVNCYSEGMNRRLGTGLPFKPGHRRDVELFLDETMLTQPLRWKRPRMIFVCSMTDLFAEFVPDEWIDRVFAVMALAPRHTFQVLTKRSARMRAYLSDPGTPGRIARVLIDMCMIDRAWPFDAEAWPVRSIGDVDDPDDVTVAMPLPNVWLGVSAEDQTRADERIPDLLATPAAVPFLSAEPLLGPIEIVTVRELGWVIVGGESGPGARPMHPDWARGLRDQCAAAEVPFFFKQWGEYLPIARVGPSGVSIIQALADHHLWPDTTVSRRVGRTAAGRLLDGYPWNQMPGSV